MKYRIIRSGNPYRKAGRHESRHLYLVENFRDYVVGSDIVGLGLVGESKTMAHHIVGYGAHILGHHISAAAQESVAAGGTCQRYRGTRRSAEVDYRHEVVKAIVGGETCGKHDVDDVTLYLLVDIYLFTYLLNLDNLLRTEQRTHFLALVGDILAYDEFLFLFL